MRRGTLAQAREDARNDLEARERKKARRKARRKARSEAGQQSRAQPLTFAAKGRPLGQRSQARHERAKEKREEQAALKKIMEKKALAEEERLRKKHLKDKWEAYPKILLRPRGLGNKIITPLKQKPSEAPSMVVKHSPTKKHTLGGVGWTVENTPSPPRRPNPPVLPPIRRLVGLRM